VAILVAIAVNEGGYRDVLGAAEGMKEAKVSLINFFQLLKGHGLEGVNLIVGDKCLIMLEAVGKFFPSAKYQRCTVHYRNVLFIAFNGDASSKDAQSNPCSGKQESRALKSQEGHC
jgi:putative transposase